MWNEITLNHCLILSGILFAIGMGGFLTRRNLIAVLMCIELMLNAANLLLVAYNRFNPHDQAGQIFALISIVIAACEAAIGLAIAISAFRLLGTIRTDEMKEMKG
jgi:NADH:ubiquinone oxidoreductase subunit K